MTAMPKLAVVLSIVVALTASLIASVALSRKAETEKVWKTLEGIASGAVLAPTNADFRAKSDWLASTRSGNYEVGRLALKDGSRWRSFASHHVLERPESFVVFKSGSNLIHARGYGFCCEVEFEGSNQQADSADFLRRLRDELGFTTSAYDWHWNDMR